MIELKNYKTVDFPAGTSGGESTQVKNRFISNTQILVSQLIKHKLFQEHALDALNIEPKDFTSCDIKIKVEKDHIELAQDNSGSNPLNYRRLEHQSADESFQKIIRDILSHVPQAQDYESDHSDDENELPNSPTPIRPDDEPELRNSSTFIWPDDESELRNTSQYVPFAEPELEGSSEFQPFEDTPAPSVRQIDIRRRPVSPPLTIQEDETDTATNQTREEDEREELRLTQSPRNLNEEIDTGYHGDDEGLPVDDSSNAHDLVDSILDALELLEDEELIPDYQNRSNPKATRSQARNADRAPQTEEALAQRGKPHRYLLRITPEHLKQVLPRLQRLMPSGRIPNGPHTLEQLIPHIEALFKERTNGASELSITLIEHEGTSLTRGRPAPSLDQREAQALLQYPQKLEPPKLIFTPLAHRIALQSRLLEDSLSQTSYFEIPSQPYIAPSPSTQPQLQRHTPAKGVERPTPFPKRQSTSPLLTEKRTGTIPKATYARVLLKDTPITQPSIPSFELSQTDDIPTRRELIERTHRTASRYVPHSHVDSSDVVVETTAPRSEVESATHEAAHETLLLENGCPYSHEDILRILSERPETEQAIMERAAVRLKALGGRGFIDLSDIPEETIDAVVTSTVWQDESTAQKRDIATRAIKALFRHRRFRNEYLESRLKTLNQIDTDKRGTIWDYADATRSEIDAAILRNLEDHKHEVKRTTLNTAPLLRVESPPLIENPEILPVIDTAPEHLFNMRHVEHTKSPILDSAVAAASHADRVKSADAKSSMFDSAVAAASHADRSKSPSPQEVFDVVHAEMGHGDDPIQETALAISQHSREFVEPLQSLQGPPGDAAARAIGNTIHGLGRRKALAKAAEHERVRALGDKLQRPARRVGTAAGRGAAKAVRGAPGAVLQVGAATAPVIAEILSEWWNS